MPRAYRQFRSSKPKRCAAARLRAACESQGVIWDSEPEMIRVENHTEYKYYIEYYIYIYIILYIYIHYIYYMIYIYISEILYIIVCLCIYVQTLCKWPHLASPRPIFKRSTGQIDRCGFTGWIHRRKLNLRWESPRNHGFLRRIFTLW